MYMYSIACMYSDQFMFACLHVCLFACYAKYMHIYYMCSLINISMYVCMCTCLYVQMFARNTYMLCTYIHA